MLWFLIKFVAMSSLLFFIWKIYLMVVVPWLSRRRYSKYPNVGMTKSFHPFLGDVALINKDQADNKFRVQSHLDMAVERPDLDLYQVQIGSKIEMYPVSVTALREFEALVPHKIDRYADQIMPLQHVCGP